MRANAALTSAMLGDQRLAAAEGQRAVELLAGLPDSLTMPALVVRALTLAVSGPVAEARSLLARSEEHLRAWDPLESGQVLLVAALAWSLLEEPVESMRWFERAVGAAGRGQRRRPAAVPAVPARPGAVARWEVACRLRERPRRGGAGGGDRLADRAAEQPGRAGDDRSGHGPGRKLPDRCRAGGGPGPADGADHYRGARGDRAGPARTGHRQRPWRRSGIWSSSPGSRPTTSSATRSC